MFSHSFASSGLVKNGKFVNNICIQDERGHGSGRFDELERRNTELRHENERMKNTLARFEEHEAQLQKRIDEKMHEVTQLTAMLEQVLLFIILYYFIVYFIGKCIVFLMNIKDSRRFCETSSKNERKM